MANKYVEMDIENGGHLVIMEPESCHCEELAFAMRDADRREVGRALPWMSTIQIVNMCIDLSIYSRVATINGKTAAMWGLVVTSLLGSHGYPWAMTTPMVERFKRTFIIGSRFYVNEMNKITPTMSVNVDESYSAALRWLKHLGFNVDRRIAVNGHPFREARMEVS